MEVYSDDVTVDDNTFAHMSAAIKADIYLSTYEVIIYRLNAKGLCNILSFKTLCICSGFVVFPYIK